MLGTFARALGVRKIKFGYEDILAEGVGEIVKAEDGVLVLTRIVITYKFRADGQSQETIERANDVHANGCPVHRSIEGSIEVVTNVEYVS